MKYLFIDTASVNLIISIIIDEKIVYYYNELIRLYKYTYENSDFTDKIRVVFLKDTRSHKDKDT